MLHLVAAAGALRVVLHRVCRAFRFGFLPGCESYRKRPSSTSANHGIVTANLEEPSSARGLPFAAEYPLRLGQGSHVVGAGSDAGGQQVACFDDVGGR